MILQNLKYYSTSKLFFFTLQLKTPVFKIYFFSVQTYNFHMINSGLLDFWLFVRQYKILHHFIYFNFSAVLCFPNPPKLQSLTQCSLGGVAILSVIHDIIASTILLITFWANWQPLFYLIVVKYVLSETTENNYWKRPTKMRLGQKIFFWNLFYNVLINITCGDWQKYTHPTSQTSQSPPH